MLLFGRQLAALEELVLLADQVLDVREDRSILFGGRHASARARRRGGSPRTGTRHAVPPRRSTPRAGWRWRHRLARRTRRALRAWKPEAAGCPRAARPACRAARRTRRRYRARAAGVRCDRSSAAS